MTNVEHRDDSIGIVDGVYDTVAADADTPTIAGC